MNGAQFVITLLIPLLLMSHVVNLDILELCLEQIVLALLDSLGKMCMQLINKTTCHGNQISFRLSKNINDNLINV